VRPDSGDLLDHEHRFACVSSVPLFSGLEEEDRHRIAERVITRPYRRGEVVYSIGDSPGLQIVHSGRVKQSRVLENGNEQLLRVLSPGDFTGEHALLGDEPVTSMAVAATDAQVCSLARSDMDRFLADYPRVAMTMLRSVARRLEATEHQVAEITGRSVESRLGEYLVAAAAEAGVAPGAGYRLPMPKKDLASYLGTTPETLSRRLHALADQGLIALGRGNRVTVLDEPGLLLL
jgi:CRP/FNR family transcriptional regulator, anaerobic regulatory protein